MNTIALVIWIIGGYGDGGTAISIKEPLWFSSTEFCEEAAKKIMEMKQPRGYAAAACIRLK